MTATEMIVHTAAYWQPRPAPTFAGDQPDPVMAGRKAASEAGSDVILLPSTGDGGTISNRTVCGNFIPSPGE